MDRSSLFLSLAAAFLLPAQAAVQFVPDFEAGSKWYTEPWSADARAEMSAFFSEMGPLFDSDLTVRVRITDDAIDYNLPNGHSAWGQFYHVDSVDGLVWAPVLWLMLVKGMSDPAESADVLFHWNLNLDRWAGSSEFLISNIRPMARHEMLHALGARSFLTFSLSSDPRGGSTYATLLDTFYRDVDGAPLLGLFSPSSYSFTVRNFNVHSNWSAPEKESGLYIEGRDLQGRLVKMPPITWSDFGYIDFEHIRGIAYYADHPEPGFVDRDFNFLRALGYPLAVDKALLQQAAQREAFGITQNGVFLTFASKKGHYYRFATSTNLENWTVMPIGREGDGEWMSFGTPPPDMAAEPRRFYQVVEVPE